MCYQLRPLENITGVFIQPPTVQTEEKSSNRYGDSNYYSNNQQSETMRFQRLPYIDRVSDSSFSQSPVVTEPDMHPAKARSKMPTVTQPLPSVEKPYDYWKCQKCTYHNLHSNDVCDICLTEKIPHSCAITSKLGMF